MRPPVLPKPTNLDEGQGIRGPDMWVDEAIWGHRLYDEQTPWLAFLEFLNVLQSEANDGRAFRESNGPNTLEYRPRRYLYLRNILFNNPRLPAFLRDLPDDDTRWTDWAEYMGKNADGLRGQPSFHLVRARFASFEEFTLVVHLLRTTAIEGQSNKRWTSKFVFPYGPAALYEDLNVKPQSITNDRRFFGRVGELVYLMLSRSGKADELLTSLRPLGAGQDMPLESTRPRRSRQKRWRKFPLVRMRICRMPSCRASASSRRTGLPSCAVTCPATTSSPTWSISLACTFSSTSSVVLTCGRPPRVPSNSCSKLSHLGERPFAT